MGGGSRRALQVLGGRARCPCLCWSIQKLGQLTAQTDLDHGIARIFPSWYRHIHVVCYFGFCARDVRQRQLEKVPKRTDSSRALSFHVALSEMRDARKEHSLLFKEGCTSSYVVGERCVALESGVWSHMPQATTKATSSSRKSSPINIITTHPCEIFSNYRP